MNSKNVDLLLCLLCTMGYGRPTGIRQGIHDLKINLVRCLWCAVCVSVVVFCHSSRPVMGRFLFRAQEHNMTNGDFAFFTYWTQQTILTDKPWIFYVTDKSDIRRLLPAFRVVKQVGVCERFVIDR